ncbi:splicing factor u2af 65 kda subunit [Anaeramoeba flamelloides]|uniref:Splicing factor u2af 65 kDa subunit n=1 Tax=Anaeramoeba flamelloides TaxID=1746091 RepID=A0AAV7YJN8_9EUKA|nr:splicing factor u2af 65 kda subunit [Anaeramoeba flamelloides]
MNEQPKFIEQRSQSDQNQQYQSPNQQMNFNSENQSTENKSHYQNERQNTRSQNRSENRYDQQKRNYSNEGLPFRDNNYQTNTTEKRMSSFNNDYNRENKNPENGYQSQLENENRPRSNNRNTRWGKRHRQRNEQTSNYQQRSQQMRQNFNQNTNNDEFSENNPRFNRYKRDSRDRRENFSNLRDQNRSRNNYSNHRYNKSYDGNTRNENRYQKRNNSYNNNNWETNQQTNNLNFNNEYPQQQQQQQQQQFNNLRSQNEQSQYPNTRNKNNQTFSGTNNSAKELYIGNIPPYITPNELVNFINQALTIRKIVSGFNSATNARLTKNKKAAFVGFKNEQIATEALKLDGVKIENNVLRIARPISYQEKIVTSSLQTQQNFKHTQNVNNQPNPNEIYIGGLDKEINEQHLLMIMSKCGEINNLRLITDNSLNYGLVEFKTEEQAKNACQLLNDQIFYNSKLIVCPSSSVTDLKNTGNSNQILPKNTQPNNLQPLLTQSTVLQQNLQNTSQNQNNLENNTGNYHQILNPYLLSKLKISDILNFNIPFTIKSSETKVDSIQNVNPTPIVVLYNIINKKILQNEQLCQNNLIEILKQASNYGTIEEIYFPRRLNNPQNTELTRHFGKIFLKYSSINGATFLLKEVSKKVFNSRTCIVSFFQENDYQNLSQQFPSYIIHYKNNSLIFPQQYQNINQQNITYTQNLNQNQIQNQNQNHNKDQIQNQQDLHRYQISQNHSVYENTSYNKNNNLYDNSYKNQNTMKSQAQNLKTTEFL